MERHLAIVAIILLVYGSRTKSRGTRHLQRLSRLCRRVLAVAGRIIWNNRFQRFWRHSGEYFMVNRFRSAASTPNFLFFLISLFFLIVIIYANFIPFNFSSKFSLEVWDFFQHIPYLESRAGWESNLLMYIPPAFFMCGYLHSYQTNKLAKLLGVFFTLIFYGTVIVSIEFFQIYFPPRTVSLNDIIAEFSGVVLGVILWILFGNRFINAWQSIRNGGQPAIFSALIFYVIGHIIFCLLPFDFILSLDILYRKLGNLMANSECNLTLRCLAKNFAVVIINMPIGILLGLLWGTHKSTTIRNVLIFGIITSISIELIKFFEASGISQWLSLLTRPLGMGLGLWLLKLHQKKPIWLSQATIKVGISFLILPYLILLAALNGWFSQAWFSWQEAVHQINELQLLPFYYHYYVPEANALSSLIYVAGNYVPIGLGLWLWRALPRRADRLLIPALLAGGCALIMETGKLFLSKHPDLTNILIAIASAVLSYIIASWIRRWNQNTVPQPLKSTIPAATEAITPLDKEHQMTVAFGIFPVQRLLALSLLGIVIFAVSRYPLEPVWLAIGLTFYALLLWRYPSVWLVVVPALLPILDLTFWSGRFFFNEFDIVILLTIAIVWWRLPLITSEQILFPRTGFIIGIVVLTQLISTAIGLFPPAPLDANAFSNYYSTYNSLRVSKGFWWALFLLPLLRQEVRQGTSVNHLFSIGMLIGLAGTSFIIAWERVIFSGLFNFNLDYRVTALFSGMHTGGAFIDGYLATALPFVITCFLSGGFIINLTGIGIFSAALYGILVTFSRVDYLSFTLTGLVLCCGTFFLIKRIRKIGHILLISGIILVLTIIIVLPVLRGSYIQERFSSTTESLETRLKHWHLTLSMMNDNWTTAFFGMGKGSFPRTYFLKSNQNFIPTTYQYLIEKENQFLRLGSGESLYMGQRINLSDGDSYTLNMDLRSNVRNGVLTTPICEKSVLYSFNCNWISIKTNATLGEWSHYQTTVEPSTLGKGHRWYTQRPLEIALYNGQSGSVLDIDNVKLTTPDGDNLIKNGDFSAGQDYWFFSTDSHLAWHSKNLWIQILFEEGWVGLTVFTILLFYLFSTLYQRICTGDSFALLLMASLTGFLTIGLSDSLFDEPRMTLLFFLIAWLAMVKPHGLIGKSIQKSLPHVHSPHHSRSHSRVQTAT